MVNENGLKIIADGNRTLGAVPEKDGVHFGYFAAGNGQPELLLYEKNMKEVAARLPFPKSGEGDNFYSMKVKLPLSKYEYNFCEGETVVTDPYARLVRGRERFGETPDSSPHGVRGGFAGQKYDWTGDCVLAIPYHEAVMYHLHVRGFTRQKNSGVRKKGTFAGLQEKIPYLKKLGINQVKLMPVYEFDDMVCRTSVGGSLAQTQREAAARAFDRPEKEYKLNYWGYGGGFYFAPKAAYAAGGHPDREFKDMVKAFHMAGIEVILEFCFTDSTDFVLIARCLAYWAEEYHVDGFSVIARDSVVAELARLPLFRRKKLISTWYPDMVKAYNTEKNHCLLAESNDGFMNDCRRLLKGDEQFLSAFSFRLRSNDSACPPVNYITNHDGFTLLDLVSYEHKYNAENGEMDRDGTDYNFSWNCGEEGPSRKREIVSLRLRQRKNAYAMLLFSQGVPMLLAGDEFGNTQKGNNNPWCHDSELTWLDWGSARSNRELTGFVRDAIAFRKKHRVLHQDRSLRCADQFSSGFPDLSFHGDQAWYGEMDRPHRYLGCMYSGYYAKEEGFVYVAYNFHWEPRDFALPLLPKGQKWRKVMDTSLKRSFVQEEEQEILAEAKSFSVPARTVVVLEGK